MPGESRADALARLYDLDLSEDPGDLDLYLALAGRTQGPIAELAVGTGRIAVPLAAAGHAVTGVDLDPAALDRARARAVRSGRAAADRLRLVEGDLLAAAIPDSGGFGLAILGLNSILLLAARGQQRQAIRRMYELLEPGGIVAIDVWLPGAEDLARFDGRLSLEWLRTDPESGRDVAKLAAAWFDAANRVVTLTTIFDEAEPGGSPRRWTRSDALRLIGPDELRDYAEEAGFEIETIAGDYDLSPFDAGSDRAILIGRRPGRPGTP
jgi:SAM-dependent methyltransferase